MSENDPKKPNQSLFTRLIVIALILAVIVITIIAGKKATSKSVKKTPQSTPSVLTPTPATDQKEVQIDSRCFITLNGKRYDVSSFRGQHEGGDIFACGTDMTEEFKGEHRNDFARADDYEVDENGDFINKK